MDGVNIRSARPSDLHPPKLLRDDRMGGLVKLQRSAGPPSDGRPPPFASIDTRGGELPFAASGTDGNCAQAKWPFPCLRAGRAARWCMKRALRIKAGLHELLSFAAFCLNSAAVVRRVA